ncbi:MAG: hypothetical protein ABIR66_07400 [Saprospiraceae bacterium]
MKFILTLVSSGLTWICLAQTPINKTFPVTGAQKIDMHFDYPHLVRVSSWDKNEVSISGTISINGGENDDAFKLTSSTNNATLSIEGEVANIKSLPQRITVTRKGEKMVFKNKEEFNKYKQEHGEGFDMVNWGHDIEIVLEVKVPRTMNTCIKSVYGTVELKDLDQTMALVAESTYGGVDASLNTSTIGELFATTDFGQIYTNLDIKFSGEGLKQRDFHTEVMAKPGKGPKYSFESKYGNVYLRKK